MDFPVTCDWCGKGKPEIQQLIASSGIPWLKPPKRETCICNECIELLVEVMAIEHPDWYDQMLQNLAAKDRSG